MTAPKGNKTLFGSPRTANLCETAAHPEFVLCNRTVGRAELPHIKEADGPGSYLSYRSNCCWMILE